MRILLVSQMYPTAAEPDLGSFIAQVERELRAQGHEVEPAVIGRRGGSKTKYLRLASDAVRGARRFDPDVVFAHFLAPAGTIGALAAMAGRMPLVVMAHGRDVRNVGSVPGVRAVTAWTLRRASAVIANSAYLGRELEAAVPGTGPVEVIDCGVDLARFQPGDLAAARAATGWDGEGPRFLFVGGLDERKNVARLADAFALVGRGSLALVGDGPLRGSLAGRPGVTLAGPVSHDRVPAWMAACDVLCLPSTVEPFGQVLLEAMACGRPVVATRVGGPAEFVTPEAGVLVDPLDVDSIAAGMEAAAALPAPNPAALAIAAEHEAGRQAQRMAEVLARAVRG